jgi:hypothetical protein
VAAPDNLYAIPAQRNIEAAGIDGIIRQVITTRRLIAIICIAVIIVTGVMPGGAALLRGVLVPLGPLFGTILSAPLPPVADAGLPSAPILPALAARPPPLA